MDNFSFFPVLVSRVSSFVSEDACKKISDVCLNSHKTKHDSILFDGGSNFTGTSKFLNNFPQLVLDIENTINLFIQNYSANKLIITNSWFNIQNKGSVLKMHVHPESIISGALYINVDKQSSKIFFENPNYFLAYLFNQADNEIISPYRFEHVWIEPQLGDLILFPSWLRHGSYNDVNQTDNRIVLSFNTTFI